MYTKNPTPGSLKISSIASNSRIGRYFEREEEKREIQFCVPT